jgi:hypothetical protein
LRSDESASSQHQLADLKALIDVIESRLQEIEVETAEHSAPQRIFPNELRLEHHLHQIGPVGAGKTQASKM